MHIQDFFQNFLKFFLIGLHDDCTINLIAQDMSPCLAGAWRLLRVRVGNWSAPLGPGGWALPVGGKMTELGRNGKGQRGPVTELSKGNPKSEIYSLIDYPSEKKIFDRL